MIDINDFDAIRIGLASPKQIREWSSGEVTKPETINYRTLKPEKGRPSASASWSHVKDWECYCGASTSASAGHHPSAAASRRRARRCAASGWVTHRPGPRRSATSGSSRACPRASVTCSTSSQGAREKVLYLRRVDRDVSVDTRGARDKASCPSSRARSSREKQRLALDKEELLLAARDAHAVPPALHHRRVDEGDLDEDDEYRARTLNNWAEEAVAAARRMPAGWPTACSRGLQADRRRGIPEEGARAGARLRPCATTGAGPRGARQRAGWAATAP